MKPLELATAVAKSLQGETWAQSVRIGGSLGRGKADALSDVDIFATYLSRDEPIAFARLPHVVAAAGFHALFYRGPTYVEGFGHAFSFYCPREPVLQFNLIAELDLKPHYMQHDVSSPQLDRTGIATATIDLSRALDLEPEPIAWDAGTFAFFRLLGAAHEQCRGRELQAQKFLRDALDRAVVLAWLAARKSPPGHNYREPWRAVEEQLDADQVASLRIASVAISNGYREGVTHVRASLTGNLKKILNKSQRLSLIHKSIVEME